MANGITIARKDGASQKARYKIEDGIWHDDGWIGARLRLRLLGVDGPCRMSFDVYCSDMSMRLYQNRLTVSAQGAASEFKLKWGGMTRIEFPVVPDGNKEALIDVSVAGFLVPDQFDNRERAVVIRAMTLQA